MPGPLPTDNRRRRNAPTIPSTALSAAGRSAPVPRVPRHIALGAIGKAWWRWAWKTPEAGAWSDGQVEVVGRRARLEDDLAALRKHEDHVPGTVAEGRIVTAMLAIDVQLGLTPKSRAQMRWRIVADASLDAGEAEPNEEDGPPRRRSDVRRLRAVDPTAGAGA